MVVALLGMSCVSEGGTSLIIEVAGLVTDMREHVHDFTFCFSLRW